MPPEVEAVLIKVLAQEIVAAVNRQPPPPARPVANTAPPAWATRLLQQVAANQKRIDDAGRQITALQASQRQPLIDFILVNSELYSAGELEGMSLAEVERIARLVDQAVGPRGRMNVLVQQGLIAQPLSLFDQWEPYSQEGSSR